MQKRVHFGLSLGLLLPKPGYYTVSQCKPAPMAYSREGVNLIHSVRWLGPIY